MKKPVFVNPINNVSDYKSNGFDLPKEASLQEFFSLRNPRRKNKIEELVCSMTIDFNTVQPRWIPSKAYSTNIIEKSSTFNNQVSQQFENAEQTICFTKRNKKNIQRNRPQIQKLSGNFWKLYIPPTQNNPHLPHPPHIQKIHSFTNSKMSHSIPKVKKWSKQDFIFIKKIGQGSYSIVYVAIQKASNFICCIKILRKKQIKQQHIHVVIRQLKIHHYLQHKYINELYGQFDDDQHIYLIGQYCTNGDLHKYVRQKQRQCVQLELQEIKHFIRQICQAVAVMHKDSLMHRDIKPQNIFLTMAKGVKLGDFGWSVYNGGHGLRNTQCGTPFYLAPQLIQQQQYSQSIDIWAIGILAYQLLTGQLPFKISGTKDLTKIITQNIKFQYIDDQIARDFVQKLLEKDNKLRMEIQDVLQHPFISNVKCQ